MTKLIDGDRLEAWLQDQGGIDALLIQLVLDDFIYQPPQTPKSKIKKSAKELVRRRDPGTSWDAALSITPEKRQELYRILYALLSKHSLTDDEIRPRFEATNYPHSASGLRSRRAELVAAGWVRDSGNKRVSENGHPSTVWEALLEVAA